MATEFIRVKSKSTGHEYSLPADAFDPEAHKKIAGEAEADGVVIPPVLNAKVGPVEESDQQILVPPVSTTAPKSK